jgi:hypothetical protein
MVAVVHFHVVDVSILQVEDEATVPAIAPTRVREFIEELRSYGR